MITDDKITEIFCTLINSVLMKRIIIVCIFFIVVLFGGCGLVKVCVEKPSDIANAHKYTDQRPLTTLSASCPHPCLAVAERHSLDAFLTFASDVDNLLESLRKTRAEKARFLCRDQVTSWNITNTTLT